MVEYLQETDFKKMKKIQKKLSFKFSCWLISGNLYILINFQKNQKKMFSSSMFDYFPESNFLNKKFVSERNSKSFLFSFSVAYDPESDFLKNFLKKVKKIFHSCSIVDYLPGSDLQKIKTIRKNYFRVLCLTTFRGVIFLKGKNLKRLWKICISDL